MLSAAAVVIAVASAVAGGLSSSINGYLFVDNTFPTADQCIDQGKICDTLGTSDCTVTVNGSPVVLRPNSNVAASCGTPNLKRI